MQYSYIVVRTSLDLFINGGRWECVTLIQYSWWIKIFKDGHYTSTIPVVGHTTSVVDVSRSVFQNLRKSEWVKISQWLNLISLCLSKVEKLVFEKIKIHKYRFRNDKNIQITQYRFKQFKQFYTVFRGRFLYCWHLLKSYVNGYQNNMELVKQIWFYLERNIRIFIEEHTKLTDTDLTVTFSELVRYVESKWSVFSSLQSNSVKQTQWEQKIPEFVRLKIKKKMNVILIVLG